MRSGRGPRSSIGADAGAAPGRSSWALAAPLSRRRRSVSSRARSWRYRPCARSPPRLRAARTPTRRGRRRSARSRSASTSASSAAANNGLQQRRAGRVQRVVEERPRGSATAACSDTGGCFGPATARSRRAIPFCSKVVTIQGGTCTDTRQQVAVGRASGSPAARTSPVRAGHRLRDGHAAPSTTMRRQPVQEYATAPARQRCGDDCCGPGRTCSGVPFSRANASRRRSAAATSATRPTPRPAELAAAPDQQLAEDGAAERLCTRRRASSDRAGGTRGRRDQRTAGARHDVRSAWRGAGRVRRRPSRRQLRQYGQGGKGLAARDHGRHDARRRVRQGAHRADRHAGQGVGPDNGRGDRARAHTRRDDQPQPRRSTAPAPGFGEVRQAAAKTLKTETTLRGGSGGAQAGKVEEVNITSDAVVAFVKSVRSSGVPSTLRSAGGRRDQGPRPCAVRAGLLQKDVDPIYAAGPALIAPLSDATNRHDHSQLIADLHAYARSASSPPDRQGTLVRC